MDNFKFVFIKIILISVVSTNAKKVSVFYEMPKTADSSNINDIINKLIKPLQDSQALNKDVELEIVVQSGQSQKKYYPKLKHVSQNQPQGNVVKAQNSSTTTPHHAVVPKRQVQQLYIINNPREPFAISEPDLNQEVNIPIEMYEDVLPEIHYPRARVVNVNRPLGRMGAVEAGRGNRLTLATWLRRNAPPVTGDIQNPQVQPTDEQLRLNEDKRPVLMKDLKEAIERFEKRMNDTFMSSKDNKNKAQPQQGLKKKITNVDDLVELIKKGVEVQFEAKKPSDDRFDWVQVKIPNKPYD